VTVLNVELVEVGVVGVVGCGSAASRPSNLLDAPMVTVSVALAATDPPPLTTAELATAFCGALLAMFTVTRIGSRLPPGCNVVLLVQVAEADHTATRRRQPWS
jgi:hypothetical protein